jgi:hypothetical protein
MSLSHAAAAPPPGPADSESRPGGPLNAGAGAQWTAPYRAAVGHRRAGKRELNGRRSATPLPPVGQSP